jgi:hypothetical protein
MSVSTTALRRQLATAIADDSAAAVVSSARQLLESSGADVDSVVLEALMVGLLHTEQPDAVLQLAADGRFTSAIRSSPRLSLCHAYALYRLRDLDGCLSLLQSPPLASLKDDAGVSHLRAQAEYKRGRFAEAVNVYQSEFKAQEVSHTRPAGLQQPRTAVRLLPLCNCCCAVSAVVRRGAVSQHAVVAHPRAGHREG